MTQLDQMAGDLTASVNIVMVNRVSEIFCGLIVDYNQWNSVMEELPALFLAERGGANNDAIHAMFNHRLDNFLFLLRVSMRRRDEDAVSAPLNATLDALEN